MSLKCPACRKANTIFTLRKDGTCLTCKPHVPTKEERLEAAVDEGSKLWMTWWVEGQTGTLYFYGRNKQHDALFQQGKAKLLEQDTDDIWDKAEQNDWTAAQVCEHLKTLVPLPK